MKEVKDSVQRGDLDIALIKPELIYHQDQLILAVHKSLYYHKHLQLRTKSIGCEIVYNLHPSKSIRDSLITFGAQEKDTAAVVITVGDIDMAAEKNIFNSVEGLCLALEEAFNYQNVKLIKKVYKIPEHVKKHEAILNTIVTKMAAKELLH